MSVDGTNQRRVASATSLSYEPSFSPDGRAIIYGAGGSGEPQLHVVTLATSSDLALTTGAGGGESASWESIGAPAPRASGRIAFSSPHNPDRDICPAWSPTDSRIAYINGTDLYTIAPDGSSRQRLASDVDGCPAWSPDGRQIAFSRTHGLRIMSADGTSVRALTTPTGSGIDRSPTWSADATEIAFVRTPAWPGASEVDIIHVDGTGVRKLVRNGAFDPAWSPDGRTILYTAGDDSTGGGDSKIHAIAPSGSSDRPITDPTGGPEAAAWQALP